MRKFIAALAFLYVVAGGALGQMINTRSYAEIFGFRNGVVDPDEDFVFDAPVSESAGEISNLAGKQRAIDTPLELALFSYYAASRINVRPTQANAILPANNPKLADQKLGAAVFQEIQILRFLGDTAAVNRHEAVLKFITGRGNATRAEIEKFYRDNVRSLIAAVVDEEFNKVSFGLYNYGKTTLARDAKNQYILTYESAANPRDGAKTLTASSLEALVSEMRNGTNKTDFTSADLNAVRAQAALIPAVVYADWKAKGVANGVDGMALIKEALTNFYLDPNDSTYQAVYGIRFRYVALLDTNNKDIFAEIALKTYHRLVANLNMGLLNKFENERRFSFHNVARIPNDPRFNIFSTPYTVR